ncbi:hypothetical protein [Kitasatospora sp. NPDC088548]|uniref:hypothetical protein n=1 Tax=Kitasatospora sp. NPDC088548 TaxID=3364075 RepID=UPI0038294BF6
MRVPPRPDRIPALRHPARRPTEPQRAAPAVRPLGDGIEQLDTTRFRLSDGTVLAQPTAKMSNDLHRGDWVLVDKWPYQISELRVRPGGGKHVHLLHAARPVSLERNDSLPVLLVLGRPDAAPGRP